MAVFEKNYGPMIFGPKKYIESPLTLKELPKIDLFLLTHNHYDHMSIRTIKNFPYKNAGVLVPLKLGKYFTKNGNEYKITKRLRNSRWSNSSFHDHAKMNDICNKDMRYATLLFLNTSHNIYVVLEKINIGGTRPQKKIYIAQFSIILFSNL